jgi:hypothetical protein
VTYPDGTPGRHRSAILDAARPRDGAKPPGPKFTRQKKILIPELRQSAHQRFEEHQYCIYCGGLHPGISTPACPRIASFELDADGRLSSAAYWQSGDWDASDVIFSSDAEEPDDEQAPPR